MFRAIASLVVFVVVIGVWYLTQPKHDDATISAQSVTSQEAPTQPAPQPAVPPVQQQPPAKNYNF